MSAACFASQLAYTEFAVKKADANSFTFIEIASTTVFSLLYLAFFERGLLDTVYRPKTYAFFQSGILETGKKNLSASL